MASNGLDIQSDTPIGIIEDTAQMGELDALTIRANAAREGWGYDIAASNSMAESSMVKKSSRMGATSTLLSGAGSVGRDWYNVKSGGSVYG